MSRCRLDDGFEAARAVRGRWPPIKSSPPPASGITEETDLPEGGTILPKPYSPVQLSRRAA